jgi:outer membrane murein-binding lipoprotein Lpp
VSGARVVAVGAMLLALAGCGSESDADKVESAVVDLQQDVAEQRFDEACESMTPKVHKQLGESADRQVSRCTKDLDELVKLLRAGGGGGFSDAPGVAAVKVTGDRATATVEASDGSLIDVPFERRDGKWLLANFFGASTFPLPPPESPATFQTGRVRTAVLTGPPAKAVDPRSGARCSAVGERAGQIAAGGCATTIRDSGFETEVRTVFGSFDLARCRAEGKVHVSGDGRILISGFDMKGSGGEGADGGRADAACGDVYPCYRAKDGQYFPWSGRLRQAPGGRLRAQVDVCLATCVGRFEGKTDIELSRDGRGWRIDFDDAPVGPGALRLNGSVSAAGPPWLDVQTPPA